MNHDCQVAVDLAEHRPTLKVVSIFYRHEFPAPLDSAALIDKDSKEFNEVAANKLISSRRHLVK